MTALSQFREHCRRMAAADHKLDCPSLTAREPYWPPGGWVLTDPDDPMAGLTWLGRKPPWSPPPCGGCVPDADRVLFGQLADEVERYVDGQLALFDAAETPEEQR